MRPTALRHVECQRKMTTNERVQAGVEEVGLRLEGTLGLQLLFQFWFITAGRRYALDQFTSQWHLPFAIASLPTSFLLLQEKKGLRTAKDQVCVF